MKRYSDSKMQEAFNEGRKVGKLEGMISYQEHLMKGIAIEREKLVKKFQDIISDEKQ